MICGERPARLPVGVPGWDDALSRLVEIDTVGGSRSLHVLDTGSALAEAGVTPIGTILAVHGNPTWSRLWLRLAQASLEQARRGGTPWRIVAPDQLDMGFSERLPHAEAPKSRGEDEATPYRRLGDRIADLDALVEALELRSGSLVTLGHDWGGTISLGWAGRNREAVDAAITLNTAVHQPAGTPIPAPLRAALAGPLLAGSTVRTSAFLSTTLATARDELTEDTVAAYRAAYGNAALRGGIGGFVADIPVDAGHPSAQQLARVSRDLESFDKPALILWGPADPVFQEYHLADLIARLPRADVHRFEGAGHLLAEEAPAHDTILAWLDRLRSPIPQPPAPEPAPPLWSLLEQRADDESIASVDMASGTARPVSWAKLARVVGGIATGLVDAGLQPGDRVSLLIPPGNDLTAAIYACLRIGAVAVVADAGLGIEGMTRAVRAADPDWIIGEVPGLTLARVKGWPGRRVSVRPMGRLAARGLAVETSLTALARTYPEPERLPLPAPEDPAAVLFTSGSTGPAKGVLYTHGRLSALVQILIRRFEITPDAGLVAGFAPFALLGPGIGARTVTPDMEVTRPATLSATALADAARAGEATILFASPAALRNISETSDELDLADTRALAEIRLVLSAGAPVPLALMESIAQLFPNAEIHSPYGMTEGLLLTDIERREIVAAESAGGRGVCVGVPVDTVELRLSPLGPDGTPSTALLRPADAVGILSEIVVSAPHVKERYDRLWQTEARSRRDSDATAIRHRTNDIGHVDAAGRLWIEGRLQHLVTPPAGPLGPGGPEAVIGTVPGVRRAAVVGVGPVGTQAVVAVIDPDRDGLVPLREHGRDRGSRPRPPRAGLASMELADAVRAAAGEDGVELAAVLVTEDFPTDIRHNSKIDRSRLARWADEVLSGGPVRRP